MTTGDFIEEPPDPFDSSEYNMIQFVQLSRIYDVLMTLVMLEKPEAAQRLIEVHATGDLVNPSPMYTGDFLFDVENATSPDGDLSNSEEPT